jgi:alkaline phosphatase D
VTAAAFRHGVASGDPDVDRVVIWTRVSGRPGTVTVRWWMRDEAGELVGEGTAQAHPDRDHTVSVDVAGLGPGRRYRYGFAVDDEPSPVGRTRTLPRPDAATIRLGQVSCAKFNAGFFNAYARLAERDDLDLVLHLGDYIYEASNTPPASQTPGADIGRPFAPLHECRTLADYRMRYAQYHADPDVQAAHAAHPFLATLDDHELADGAWRDGAQEHLPERDGPWSERRAAAFRAREEWLPIRRPDPADPERAYRAVRLANLADLFLLDTRSRRDEPVPPPEMYRADRSALGSAQRAWLFDGLVGSTAPWRLIGNPSVMARSWNDDLPERVRRALVKVKLIGADLHGPDWDQWDGYPIERSALLRHLRDRAIRDVVVLSGDVHVGMANVLHDDDTTDGVPVAVEFVNTSLTSQNLDDKMGWAPLTESVPIANAFLAGMDHVRWIDFDSHGYTVVTVTSERVTAEWWAVDGILERLPGERRLAAWAVRRGETALEPDAIATDAIATGSALDA